MKVPFFQSLSKHPGPNEYIYIYILHETINHANAHWKKVKCSAVQNGHVYKKYTFEQLGRNLSKHWII